MSTHEVAEGGWRPTIATDAAPPAVRSLAVPLTVSAAVALLLNLAVYAGGQFAGVDFDVVSFIGQRHETVGPRAITVMTLAPWLVGGTALVLARRRGARLWPWLGWGGAVLALVTVPFFNQAALDTKLALALMHLVAGGLWSGVVRHLHRTRLPGGGGREEPFAEGQHQSGDAE